MPIFEIACGQCNYTGEVIITSVQDALACPACGSHNTQKLMSATSSLTGKSAQHLPGPGDTTCCGQSPGQGSCAGPGSCCGKSF